MVTKSKPLLALTAGDVMSTDVVRVPEGMVVRDAARLLLRNQIGGAPVVNAQGRCVGVLSATDFLRMAEPRAGAAWPAPPERPVTCSFQTRHTTSHGQEVALCTLPPGVCSLQVKQTEPGGGELIVCNQPHGVLADWQVVEVEKLPVDEVRRFMTPDPVTAPPATPIRSLARMMVDARVHRVIVVDEEQRPVGVVSGTDVLAALAYADAER